MPGTLELAAGRLELESIVRAPLVVIADPVVAASGPPATLDELAASVTTGSSPLAGSGAKPPGSSAKPPVSLGCKPLVSVGCLSGGGAVLLERPAGTILAVANPAAGSGLFVWAARRFVAVVADPDQDTPLGPVGELTVVSGRLVVGAPEVVAAWGADVDTGDGSPVRARMHRGRTRLGLIVVAHTAPGLAPATAGAGAVAVSLPIETAVVGRMALPLAG